VLDVAPSEFLMVAFVALIVIGPKDLPKAMRVVGHWVGRARGVARQFRSGFDSMVREAELEEMEKRWAAENERIMREHGAGVDSGESAPVPVDAPAEGAPAASDGKLSEAAAPDTPAPGSSEPPTVSEAAREPVSVEAPVVTPAPVEPGDRRGEGTAS